MLSSEKYQCKKCGYPARNSSSFYDNKSHQESLDCPECGNSEIVLERTNADITITKIPTGQYFISWYEQGRGAYGFLLRSNDMKEILQQKISFQQSYPYVINFQETDQIFVQSDGKNIDFSFKTGTGRKTVTVSYEELTEKVAST